MALPRGIAGVSALAREASALALVEAMHAGRASGSRRDNAYCRLEAGPAYVQALAPHDTATVWLEAVSPRFAPEVWSLGGVARRMLLTGLGFHPPNEEHQNFWCEVTVDRPQDLRTVARLMSVVLEAGYGVGRDAAVETTLCVPRASPAAARRGRGYSGPTDRRWVRVPGSSEPAPRLTDEASPREAEERAGSAGREEAKAMAQIAAPSAPEEAEAATGAVLGRGREGT
ncbi:MAG TPA: hypothetical protein VG248_05010 [Caulobacteraceae bacterium]|jgi:hypothetical protein|nr:hypothetical protein [Caulobacteraceae bacterium]